MGYSTKIESVLKKYPELDIFDAQYLYNKKFKNISKQAFYQTLSRLTKKGMIKRITNGIYCIPKQGQFGLVVAQENNIISYYLGKDNKEGIVVGYRMYNQYKLTTQVSEKVELYSKIATTTIKNIDNVSVTKINIKLGSKTKSLIELLEVLENAKNIEELDRVNLKAFISNRVGAYDQKLMEMIMKDIGYKKSTLASLKKCLDHYKIENNLPNYLNATSKYVMIELELNDESQQ